VRLNKQQGKQWNLKGFMEFLFSKFESHILFAINVNKTGDSMSLGEITIH